MPLTMAVSFTVNGKLFNSKSHYLIRALLKSLSKHLCNGSDKTFKSGADMKIKNKSHRDESQ